MATNTSVCGVCDLRHITKPSTDWCPVCEEALCSDCKDHHSLQKATRNHNTIKITDFQKLPSSISVIRQYCPDHDEIFQLFCQAHDCPICSKCVNIHRKCGDLIPLQEVIADSKNSVEFQDLVQSLGDLEQNIEMMKKCKEDNISKVGDQRRKCENEIRTIRQKINQHLDKLEGEMMKEISNAEENINKKINTLISSLEKKLKEIKEYRTIMQNIRLYASDLQAFLGMKEIQRQVVTNEEYLQSLIKSHDLDQTNMTCSIDERIHDIFTSMNAIGSVSVQMQPSDVNIFRQKDKQAQIQTERNISFYSDMMARLAQKIKIDDKPRGIRGCCITLNRELLFTCYKQDELIAMENDGSGNFMLSLKPSSAFNVVLQNDKTALVTSGNNSGITVIDLDSKRTLNYIELPNWSYGITFNTESVFVCIRGKGIQLLNRTNLQTSTIISCPMTDHSYVAEYNGHIYYTNYKTNTVTCCDMTGQTKWQFKEESILQEPAGIAVDTRGSVFIAGEKSHNIIVISADGKQHKTLLTQDDGLHEPTGLYFDKSKSKLLVANLRGCAHLFDIV